MIKQLQTVSMKVDQSKINLYAELTEDYNPIHIDPEFAKTTPMKNVIAHGTMSINLIWQSITRSLGGEAILDAALDIRFVKPLFSGETVIAGGSRNESDVTTYDVWVKKQDGTDLLVGTFKLANP